MCIYAYMASEDNGAVLTRRLVWILWVFKGISWWSVMGI